MMSATAPRRRFEVDEEWMGDYVASGIALLVVLLRRHAEFAVWLKERGRE
jgi:hypothetical protein